jgi:hypothetical protein
LPTSSSRLSQAVIKHLVYLQYATGSAASHNEHVNLAPRQVRSYVAWRRAKRRRLVCVIVFMSLLLLRLRSQRAAWSYIREVQIYLKHPSGFALVVFYTAVSRWNNHVSSVSRTHRVPQESSLVRTRRSVDVLDPEILLVPPQ